MKSSLRFRVLQTTTMAIVTAAVACGACKRSPPTSTPPARNTVSDNGTPGGATASGPGAVNVNNNVVTYQNVHIELPWQVSDVAEIIRLSQQASTGAGLTLKGATHSLWIASDGLSIRLDNRDYGTVKQGDHVTLANDGTLTVNGTPRTPSPATTTTH